MYTIKFFFEWGTDTCLWSENDLAREEYGVGGIGLDDLPLSNELKSTLSKMAVEYQTSLKWVYPPDPSPWTAEQKHDFMIRSQKVYEQLSLELGNEYEVRFLVKLPE